ncbi:ion channel [Trichocoleus sp. ST-U3]
MNRLTIPRWCNSVVLLTLISLGIIVLFALLYLGVNQIGGGMVLTRQETREADFLSLLYFSMGTFFRIGYGDQVPTGWNCFLVGVEALSSFLLELLFIAQMVTTASERFISRRLREELEELPTFTSHRYL